MPNAVMNAAVNVTVTTSVGVFQVPPGGTTCTPAGGGALVMSMFAPTGSLITTRFHWSGLSLNNVNVAIAVGGSEVTVLKARAGGTTLTCGLMASAKAGESGGALSPGGIGVGVLSSIV